LIDFCIITAIAQSHTEVR